MKYLRLLLILAMILPIFVKNSQVEAVEYAPSTIAYWKFDENNGTTAYDSVGGYSGILQNGASLTSEGKAGGALVLDAPGEYVDAGYNPLFSFDGGSGDYTVDAWIYPTTIPDYASAIVSTATEDPYTGWSFYFYGENPHEAASQRSLGFGGNGSWEITSSGNMINICEWTHIAVTKSGMTYTLYKNGSPISWTSTGPYDPATPWAMTGTLKIGQDYPDGSTDLFGFTGSIDEVEICNQALTDEEILQHYQNGAEGHSYYYSPGLLGQWHFEAQTFDSSENGNDGTLFNTNSPLPYGPGKIGKALNLDGIDDYVDCGNNASLNLGYDPLTISLWVKFNSLENEQVLVEKYIETLDATTRTGWTLTKLANNDLRFAVGTSGIGDAAFMDDATINIETGHWYHTAVTREGNIFTVYWDGVPVTSGTLGTTLDTTSTMKIGHRGNPNDTPGSNDGGGYYLNGTIDEVAIYNYALSSADITQQASINSPPFTIADSYSTTINTDLNITAPGVLGNDIDPENSLLTASLVNGPANGTLSLNTDGSFTYSPFIDYIGADGFIYKANDGTNNSVDTTVTINVNPVETYGSISGYITEDDQRLIPISGAWIGVSVYDAQNPKTLDLWWGQTDTNGNYTVSGLPSGTYRLHAWADGHVQKMYDNTFNWQQAIGVSVNAPNDTPNIDFVLERGGTISGTVTNSTDNPLADISIDCWNTDIVGIGGGAKTDVNGHYTIANIPFGDYNLAAPSGGRWGEGDDGYSRQVFDSNQDGNADIITISTDSPDITGIDFSLVKSDSEGFAILPLFDKDGSMSYVGINVSKTPSPFNDSRVRLATYLALDRATIASAFSGDSTEVVSIVNPASPNPNVNRSYDPNKGKQLLADAGYPNGFFTTLTTTPMMVDLASVIKVYLGAVGIDTQIVIIDPTLFNNQLSTGSLGFFLTETMHYMNQPYELLGRLLLSSTGGVENYTGYQNLQFDTLFGSGSYSEAEDVAFSLPNEGAAQAWVGFSTGYNFNTNSNTFTYNPEGVNVTQSWSTNLGNPLGNGSGENIIAPVAKFGHSQNLDWMNAWPENNHEIVGGIDQWTFSDLAPGNDKNVNVGNNTPVNRDLPFTISRSITPPTLSGHQNETQQQVLQVTATTYGEMDQLNIRVSAWDDGIVSPVVTAASYTIDSGDDPVMGSNVNWSGGNVSVWERSPSVGTTVVLTVTLEVTLKQDFLSGIDYIPQVQVNKETDLEGHGPVVGSAIFSEHNEGGLWSWSSSQECIWNCGEFIYDSVVMNSTRRNSIWVGFNTDHVYNVSGNSFTYDGNTTTGTMNWSTNVNNGSDNSKASIISPKVQLVTDRSLIWFNAGPQDNRTFDPVTSTYRWLFNDVGEKSGAWVGTGANIPVLVDPGFDVVRSVNPVTIYGGQGNSIPQTLIVAVTPRVTMDQLNIDVNMAEDNKLSPWVTSASYSLGTDTSSNAGLNAGGRTANMWVANPKIGNIYTLTVNISVTLKVDLPNPAEFMPQVQIHRQTTLGIGTEISDRSPIITNEAGIWDWSATGSYFWNWNKLDMQTVILNNYAGPPRSDVSGLISSLEGVVPFVQVNVIDNQTKKTVGFTRSGTDGVYSINLPPGGYLIQALPSTSDLPYINEYYGGSYFQVSATVVQVDTNGTSVTDKNIVLDPAGFVSGLVVDSGTGKPIGGAYVNAFDYSQPGPPIYASTQTGIDGTYTLNLPIGEYRIGVTANGKATEYYPDMYYIGPEILPITILLGDTVTDIDFSLEPGFSISGSVKDASGNGIGMVFLTTIPENNPSVTIGISLTTNGAYTISGLPIGTYKVACYGSISTTDYPRIFYNSKEFLSQADDVIIENTNVNGIDFTLSPTGSGKISGYVYLPDGITPIRFATVEMYTNVENNWDLAYTFLSNKDGSWVGSNLKAGTYRVVASVPGYVDEWYQDVFNPDSASVVAIENGVTTSGINFIMIQGVITGQVTTNKGQGITGVLVNALDSSTYKVIASTNSGTNGFYTLKVPVNSYLIQAQPSATGMLYRDEYYNGVYNIRNAAIIQVTAGQIISGINFRLQSTSVTISSVSPNIGRTGQTIPVVITGTNFNGVSSVTFGSGITVTNFTFISSTQINTTIKIGTGAFLGPRDITVTTPAGKGTLTGGFTVLDGKPTVGSVNPNSGKTGQTLNVTISGTNFAGASMVSFGSRITVSSYHVDNDNQITATVNIGTAAAIGLRDVSVTTPAGKGTLASGFTVLDGKPTVGSVSPNNGKTGQTLTVTISGTNFTGTSAVSFGSRITVNSMHVDNDNQITATINIGNAAAIGPRDVSVTNTAGKGTLANGFTVFK
jgi:hypothetical protein